MAYTPNSFGASIGVTDQQLMDAFKSNNPNLQANMQEFMRTHGRTNADLLDMVKHYAPEAALDLNQITSYTKIPNNQSGQMFSTAAPVTGGQLSQFGQGLAAAKTPGLTQPAQGMTGSGAIPQPLDASGRSGMSQKGSMPMQPGVMAPPRVDYNPVATRSAMPTKFDAPQMMQLGPEGLQQISSGMAGRPGKFDQLRGILGGIRR